jgi:hypothetical protein
MASNSGKYPKFDRRVARHRKWLGVLVVLFLLVLGNLTLSLVRDMGGLQHVRQVGVVGSAAEAAKQDSPDNNSQTRAIGLIVLQLFILSVLGSAIRGRLRLLSRLRELREVAEMSLPGG